MSGKCSVAAATPSTWIAGVHQVDATGDTTFLDPVTLTAQDLFSWPLILEWDIYGYIDVDATATAGRLVPGIWADGDLTKELPTYVPAAGIGSASWPTTVAANRTTKTSANILYHQMPSALVTVSASKRVAFHNNIKVAFVSAQVQDQAAGTMQWRQITRSMLTWNTDVGSSAAGAGTFVVDAGDCNTTSSSTCLSMSDVDCTNGIKMAYAMYTMGFANTSRVVLVGGVVRTVPEASNTFTL